MLRVCVATQEPSTFFWLFAWATGKRLGTRFGGELVMTYPLSVRRAFSALVVLVLLNLIGSSVYGQTSNIVIPAGLENMEGDEALAVPFTAPSNARSQSLYEASNFSFSGPTIISQIAYRLDGGVRRHQLHDYGHSNQLFHVRWNYSEHGICR